MGKSKRYTWTVSVIAMVDKVEEVDGVKVQLEAYNEFEKSITSIKNPNKGIKFVIYLYDVKTKTAQIKESLVREKKCSLVSKKKNLQVPDFYVDGYQHLVDFFKKYVAKKSCKKNEVHQHFFIVWGHAAGLGFLKQRIQNNLKAAIQDEDGYDEAKAINIEKVSDKILSYNYLSSQLSVRLKEVPSDLFLKDLTGNKLRNTSLTGAVSDKKIIENFKVITALELNQILEKGLSEDSVSVTSANLNLANDKSAPKIQIMLCLSCYVNMIETGYAFKNMVNIYVAPQTQISHYGFNYKSLFRLISNNPKISDTDISINITHNYLTKYLEPPIAKQVKNFIIYRIDYKNGVSFSSIRLSGYIAMTEKLKQLKCDLYDLGNAKEYLSQAREKCLALSKNGTEEIGIIDYRNFLLELFRTGFNALEDINIDNYYAERYCVSNYTPGSLSFGVYDGIRNIVQSQSPNSFSIFLPNEDPLPLEKKLLEIYLAQRESNRFLYDSQWDELIKLLITPDELELNTTDKL